MNIFRVEDAYTQALEANPFLAKLNKIIDWEIFREIIEDSYSPTEHNCGRPSYDRILMCKIIILQRLYNLSDEQMEKKGICDISVKIFLGLDLSEKMPDEKTIWAFKEHLSTSDIVKKLFRKFDEQIAIMGVRVSNGQIVGASFVEVPTQRNSREENAEIKNGNTPQSFEENVHKKRQKDIDARWSVRPKENHYGYKNNIPIDEKNKFIRNYEVCSGNIHDSNMLAPMLEDEDHKVSRLHGDSAYKDEYESRVRHASDRHYENTEYGWTV